MKETTTCSLLQALFLSTEQIFCAGAMLSCMQPGFWQNNRLLHTALLQQLTCFLRVNGSSCKLIYCLASFNPVVFELQMLTSQVRSCPRAVPQSITQLCDHKCVCMQLYIERMTKAIRRQRSDAEKAAAEAAHISRQKPSTGSCFVCVLSPTNTSIVHLHVKVCLLCLLCQCCQAAVTPCELYLLMYLFKLYITLYHSLYYTI